MKERKGKAKGKTQSAKGKSKPNSVRLRKTRQKSEGSSWHVIQSGRGPAAHHGNESQDVTPAKAGVHVSKGLDSRFRGNDVTLGGAKRGISL
jgi:hypothetical protein